MRDKEENMCIQMAFATQQLARFEWCRNLGHENGKKDEKTSRISYITANTTNYRKGFVHLTCITAKLVITAARRQTWRSQSVGSIPRPPTR